MGLVVEAKGLRTRSGEWLEGREESDELGNRKQIMLLGLMTGF